MKKIILIFLTVIFVLSLTACNSGDTCTNDEFNFQFTYDENWVEKTPSDSSFIYELEYNNNRNEDNSAIAGMAVMAAPVPEGKTLDDMCSIYLNYLKDGMANYTNVKLDGIDGYWVTINDVGGVDPNTDDTREKALIIAENDKNVYAFIFYAKDKATYDQLESQADTILASFKLTNK